MFFKKKETIATEDVKKIVQEIDNRLTRIENQQERILRAYDRLNDTIAEHFEGAVDLGEITKDSV